MSDGTRVGQPLDENRRDEWYEVTTPVGEAAVRFRLWLEIEHVGGPESWDDCCNVVITLGDGQRYAANVWTEGFLRKVLAEALPRRGALVQKADLVVQVLSRECIAVAVAYLIRDGDLPRSWLEVSDAVIRNTDEDLAVLRHSPVWVVIGAGSLMVLGELARQEGATCVLLVTDPGIRAAGHVKRARRNLQRCGLEVVVFDGVEENPTTAHVVRGLEIARRHTVDFIVGLGGGSAMDCAKGINLILSNGGAISDFRGEDKAVKRMLPMIAVPTTAGTGSEGQSFALIADPVTHLKMACGDRRSPREGGLRPWVAILDEELTATQPAAVAAAAGIDALTHVVETAGTTRRSDVSLAFTRAAWERVRRSLAVVLRDPRDAAARRDMLLGAHLAGCAIEYSMLGAAHACANPLTAKYGIMHGRAVGVMLPHVVRFNSATGEHPYAALDETCQAIAEFSAEMLSVAQIAPRLRDHGVVEADLCALAEQAAQQWTATFNPRRVEAEDMLDLYRCAW
jgi:alcohol dehydrogenase